MTFKIGNFTFDRSQKLATIASGITLLTTQEIYDTFREYEAHPSNINFPDTIRGSGKSDLGEGRIEGLTATLLDDWRLFFNTVPARVTGGNLLAVNTSSNNPIANDVVTIELSTSSSLVETGVSGLTPTESAALTNIDNNVTIIRPLVESTDGKVTDLHQRQGLEIGEPVDIDDDNDLISFGTISLQITTVGNKTTITRLT